MLKNLIILALVAPFSSSIRIDSNNFCKLAGKECSSKNVPHINQCGKGICTRDTKKCNEYLRIEKALKYIQMQLILEMYYSSHIRNQSEIKLQKDFKRFQSKIKNCSPTRFRIRPEWHPRDVCVRGRHCFRKHLNADNVRKVNCSCPNDRPYVCGSHKNYCSVNEKVCGLFSHTKKHINSTGRFQLILINSCGT